MSVLHPQVQELLHSLSGRPAPQPWEMSIAAYRDAGEKLIALSGDADDRCTVTDVTIPVRQGVVTARSYRPIGADLPLPGIVYLHGGAFVRGSLDSHDRLCRKLCVQGDVIVISVAYRLAPENQFPLAHHDTADATTWVSQHAGDLGIDPAALAVAGDSSGACLAASIALTSREQGLAIKAQGLLCPALDATMSSPSLERHADGPFLTRTGLEWAYDMYVPEMGDRQSSLASPLLTKDFSGAPPAVILSAQMDPLADDARRYGDQLVASGVAVTFHEYEGMPHSFPLLAGVLDDGEHAITELATELAALLRADGRQGAPPRQNPPQPCP